MSKRILVLHGPNLNLLGVREPEVYGTMTLEALEEQVRTWGKELDLEITTFQSNSEGQLIDEIHRARGHCEGIVVNAGALAHYSYALADALAAVRLPVVEVHLSNIFAREPHRRQSVLAPACVGVVAGLGPTGYRAALEVLA